MWRCAQKTVHNATFIPFPCPEVSPLLPHASLASPTHRRVLQGSAGSETQRETGRAALTLRYGRARERVSAATRTSAGTTPADTSAGTASPGATLAGSARPATPGPAPGTAGDAVRDRGQGRDLAAVSLRDRARPQGTLQRDDRGPGRRAGHHAHRPHRTGRRRPAPPAVPREPHPRRPYPPGRHPRPRRLSSRG